MDWDFLTGPSMPPQSQLLYGCSLEAERAHRVAQGLDGLRTSLNQSYHGHMIGVTEEIRQSAKLLRDLAAFSHEHRSRTPIAANHLNILLPCMSKTLRDITSHYEDKTISRENRWKKMYQGMLKEAGGLSLPQRFVLYNHFLILLIYLLTRDKRLDPALLEQLRNKILDLRRKREIPDPVQTIAPAATIITAPADQLVQRPPAGAIANAAHYSHWCSRVFSRPLSSHTDTGLDEHLEFSLPMVSGLDPNRPRGKMLMRRAFDNNRICAKFILAGNEEEPFVELRMYENGGSLVAWRAHNDLFASREGNTVVLRRWSQSRGDLKEWARFSFVYWEELVLFYTAFVVLKARNPLGAGVNPADYSLVDEATLFQASIVDDGYKHTLMVNEDRRNAGVRLVTAVWDGELRKCPVWTAFVPTRLLHSRRWFVRDSNHLVLIKGIHLYVFCQKYREAKMRRSGSGLFEIFFTKKEGADRFVETLRSFQHVIDAPAEREYIAGPSSSQ